VATVVSKSSCLSSLFQQVRSMAIYQKNSDKVNAMRIVRAGVDRAKQHLEDYPDNHRAYYLGASALALLDEIKLAKKWVEQAHQLAPDDVATRYSLACHYNQVGDAEKALDFLENSISSRSWIENDPDLESLHGHPRFQAVLEALPE